MVRLRWHAQRDGSGERTKVGNPSSKAEEIRLMRGEREKGEITSSGRDRLRSDGGRFEGVGEELEEMRLVANDAIGSLGALANVPTDEHLGREADDGDCQG